jgi:hypothetical protein
MIFLDYLSFETFMLVLNISPKNKIVSVYNFEKMPLKSFFVKSKEIDPERRPIDIIIKPIAKEMKLSFRTI